MHFVPAAAAVDAVRVQKACPVRLIDGLHYMRSDSDLREAWASAYAKTASIRDG